ncbi:type IV toxin-antitoxin system AbiEi family antitoxin [Cupriavidus sp. AcVe19-6a]|uniref:type IV toxin-antitoxin system AbiEi family antitoxin n=1 Tax=Cupriavidus sp. AcVe19-6a TaxID=2821358 RepID=UPI001FD7D33D|nr:type IV toxin-antitoxin system AbiEi family antitoxin [Cupriavidus sp. AcVe19-6a]
MWLIIPPEHGSYGAPPVDWWLNDLMGEQEPSYYLALLSAARFWGSYHYEGHHAQVIVSRPRRTLSIGKFHVDFIVKKTIGNTPVVLERSSAAPFRVSTREATVLDLIRHQTTYGGLEVVARVVCDLAAEMTSTGLRDALRALGQSSAAQRLSFILDRLGYELLAASVETWLLQRRQRRTVQPLEPQQGPNGVKMRVDRKWLIQYSDDQAQLLSVLRDTRTIIFQPLVDNSR